MRNRQSSPTSRSLPDSFSTPTAKTAAEKLCSIAKGVVSELSPHHSLLSPFSVMADIYLALLHYPVYDKDHKVVTTSITNMDIHDIARSARTYGVTRFFVVTPVRTLRALAEKILDHWQHGYGSVYNETRKDALVLVALTDDLDSTIQAIQQETGERPRLVATSARAGEGRVTFA